MNLRASIKKAEQDITRGDYVAHEEVKASLKDSFRNSDGKLPSEVLRDRIMPRVDSYESTNLFVDDIEREGERISINELFALSEEIRSSRSLEAYVIANPLLVDEIQRSGFARIETPESISTPPIDEPTEEENVLRVRPLDPVQGEITSYLPPPGASMSGVYDLGANTAWSLSSTTSSSFFPTTPVVAIIEPNGDFKFSDTEDGKIIEGNIPDMISRIDKLEETLAEHKKIMEKFLKHDNFQRGIRG